MSGRGPIEGIGAGDEDETPVQRAQRIMEYMAAQQAAEESARGMAVRAPEPAAEPEPPARRVGGLGGGRPDPAAFAAAASERLRAMLEQQLEERQDAEQQHVAADGGVIRPGFLLGGGAVLKEQKAALRDEDPHAVGPADEMKPEREDEIKAHAKVYVQTTKPTEELAVKPQRAGQIEKGAETGAEMRQREAIERRVETERAIERAERDDRAERERRRQP